MKVNKKKLKQVIREEVLKEIAGYPDQDKVYLMFKLDRGDFGMPKGKDYYIKVPDIFIMGETSFGPSVTRGGRKRSVRGYNGLSQEGRDYFKQFKGGVFAGLAKDITWTAVSDAELPEIIELDELEPGR